MPIKTGGIGYKNRLLVSIPSDMKFFRETTTGKVIVMGRRHWKVSRMGCRLKTGSILCLQETETMKQRCGDRHDEEELMNELGKYDTEQIYIIGGESVYKMMLSYCDKIYVTKVDRAFQADTYFPNLDEMSEWKMTQESEEQTCFDLEFCFTTYER